MEVHEFGKTTFTTARVQMTDIVRFMENRR